MPAHAVPIDVKEKGVMWLLLLYSWSVRHIAQKLALSSSVVAKLRLELVAQGLLQNMKAFPLWMVMDAPQSVAFRLFFKQRHCMKWNLLIIVPSGLFVEQVREWQIISIKAYKMKLTENRRADKELRDIRSRLRELGKELTRKDKALAEAAALRMLQEKFNALWDNSDEG